MKNETTDLPHRLLPATAIRALQEAAKTPITPADPLARVKAIERAYRRIRLDHPHLFRD